MMASETKQCFKCGETKAITDFYRHPQMADGHLNKCKECTKKDVTKHRRGKGRKRILEYDRERNATDARKALKVRVCRRNRSQHPEHYVAYREVQQAIKTGRLERGQQCEICGRDDVAIHAHHEDYGKPLEVEWLCEHCHRAYRHRTVYPNIKGAEAIE